MQNNWVKHLPLAEYMHNSVSHSGTLFSPFFALTGRNPVPFQLHLFKSPTSVSAQEMASEIIHIQEVLTARLVKAQNRQAIYYDQQHQCVTYHISDKVWLKTTHLKSERPSKKLTDHKLGPFRITHCIRLQAY